MESITKSVIEEKGIEVAEGEKETLISSINN
jgi:hypothetical protein